MDNLYALIIGVGKDLPVTVQDAKAIANILCDESYCAFSKENVKLLCDKDSTKDAIIDGIEWLTENAKENSTVIIYFSGHGIQAPDYYLVPYNFQPLDLSNTAISEDEFSESVSQIKAKKIVVFLDCCHAGGQLNFKHFIKSPLPEKFADSFSSGKGNVIIASSNKNEFSLTGTPYSEFTKALIEAFAGYGNIRNDGFTRILDIQRWVEAKVPERTDNQQNPTIKIGNLEENFIISWYSAGDKRIKSLEWTTDNLPNNYEQKIEPQEKPYSNYETELLKKKLESLEEQHNNLHDLKNTLEEKASRIHERPIPADYRRHA